MGARVVARQSRQPGIDDIANARDGQRGLGDIGGQHHAARGARREYALLLAGGKAAEEGQDFDTARLVLFQSLAGFANVAFGGQEDEKVALSRFCENIIDGGCGGVYIGIVAAVLHPLVQRPVAHLDREHAARNFDDRRVVEGAGEGLSIDGGRGDDDFEFGALAAQQPQIAEQEVDIEAALMRFVDDNSIVFEQVGVGLGLSQQHPVGDDLDTGFGRSLVAEANLAADIAAVAHA